ncbi:hypothetical protein [Paracoccus sp. (in: a-proteobacteria)]|uniref:hypothetical protein n=1 Tax=Paracoccus sp. TaxID=267 RepID=UPI00333EE278
MQNNDALVVPFFKTVAIEDAIASKRSGRPIFKDQEVVEIRIAGDRNFAPTYPAKSMWKRIDGEERTYADRWPEAYARFKQGQEQVAHGTPLSELPFLTEARRQELRMLKVYTAEALASLDGKNLTSLGPHGREMKDSAAAYLERAQGLAQDIALKAEVEELKAKLAELEATKKPEPDQDEREALKAQIAEKTGARPRGNPSVETLRDMLAELEA